MTTVKPILFSGPMINALLSGSKTQTRRVLSNVAREPDGSWRFGTRYSANIYRTDDDLRERGAQCEYAPYAPGDLLWARETWATVNSFSGPGWAYRADGAFSQPEYDGEDFGAGPSFDYSKYPGEYTMWYSDLLAGEPEHGWRSSIHMPRWASRLTLEVTGVKIERLQEISEDDARAEGCEKAFAVANLRDAMEKMAANLAGIPLPSTYRCGFAKLWDSINAKRAGRSWSDNPFVIAVTFEVHQMNVDAFLAQREAA